MKVLKSLKTIILLSALGTQPVWAEEKPPKKPGDSKISWYIVPQIEADKTYRVQLNYLKLKHLKDAPKLQEYSTKVIAELNRSKGAMKFALHARPEKGEFWTLSVWESEEAMAAFARSKPHQEAIMAMIDSLDDTGFEHWDLKGSEIQSDWKEIIK